MGLSGDCQGFIREFLGNCQDIISGYIFVESRLNCKDSNELRPDKSIQL